MFGTRGTRHGSSVESCRLAAAAEGPGRYVPAVCCILYALCSTLYALCTALYAHGLCGIWYALCSVFISTVCSG